MNMNQQHLHHLQQLQQLKQENEHLKQELEFMKQILNHGDSLIFQMKAVKKQGKPLWINTQKITLHELLQLDTDPIVQQLLIERTDVKYSDR